MRLFELASSETEDRFADLLRASTKSFIHGKPQLFVPRPPNYDSGGSAPMPTPDQKFDPKPGERKPEAGFWTSTAEEVGDGWESAWSKWVKHEMPRWYSEVGTLFYPMKNARILELNSDDDVREIYNMYVDLTHAKHPDIERDMGGMKIHKNFPWPWIAQHFDAVHTTNPNGWGLHMASWDVESTVWFNMDALQKLGKVGVNSEGLCDGPLASRQIPQCNDEDEEDWDEDEQSEEDFWAERGVGQ